MNAWYNSTAKVIFEEICEGRGGHSWSGVQQNYVDYRFGCFAEI